MTEKDNNDGDFHFFTSNWGFDTFRVQARNNFCGFTMIKTRTKYAFHTPRAVHIPTSFTSMESTKNSSKNSTRSKEKRPMERKGKRTAAIKSKYLLLRLSIKTILISPYLVDKGFRSQKQILVNVSSSLLPYFGHQPATSHSFWSRKTNSTTSTWMLSTCHKVFSNLFAFGLKGLSAFLFWQLRPCSKSGNRIWWLSCCLAAQLNKTVMLHMWSLGCQRSGAFHTLKSKEFAFSKNGGLNIMTMV